MNGKFVKEQRRDATNRWWGTNPSITHLAQNYKNEINGTFHVLGFMKELYFNRGLQGWHNGKYKVIGTKINRVFNAQNIEIKRSEPFSLLAHPKKKKIILSLLF